MSYDISLQDENGNIFDIGIKIEAGGTYQVGGTSLAELNVTYNYCNIFSFRELDGLTAEDGYQKIKESIVKLKDDVDTDYWKPTEGNVKKALLILSSFALPIISENLLKKKKDRKIYKFVVD